MSLLSFTKCFIGAGGEQAATALTTAMVKMAPETATAAELKNMEQDLDAAGQLISRLQRELADERHAYDAINARYTQMMGAAENLQHQIDAAGFLKDPLQASLATLVAQIEEIVPELDQDKKDIDSTQALLTEAEAAYRAKATALTGAKAKLTRAKNDMAHATLEEQRAENRTRGRRPQQWRWQRHQRCPRRDDPDGAGDPRSRRCPRHEGQGAERGEDRRRRSEHRRGNGGGCRNGCKSYGRRQVGGSATAESTCYLSPPVSER